MDRRQFLAWLAACAALAAAAGQPAAHPYRIFLPAMVQTSDGWRLGLPDRSEIGVTTRMEQ